MTQARTELNPASIVEPFLAQTRDEEAALAGRLEDLDEEGILHLAGILWRFDRGRNGTLGATERLKARRVLERISRPTGSALAVANKVLDYLDLNADSILDNNEIELVLEIFEAFAKAQPPGEQMSERELQALYEVLRVLDVNDDHRLDKDERARLRHELEEPAIFLQSCRERSPALAKVLDGQ